LPYSSYRIFLLNSDLHLLNALSGLFFLAGIPVRGASNSCRELNDLFESCQPDLLITDVRDNEGFVFQWVEQWLQKNPGLKVIGYSECYDPEERQQMQQCGIKICISRKDSPEILLSAVKKVLGSSVKMEVDKEAVLAGLGGVREQEIFMLLGDGYKRNEIAATLQISPRTVDTYLARIKNNLGLSSMQELRRLAHDMADSFAKYR